MNLILFNAAELTGQGGLLSSRDGRAVHLLKVLHKKAGDTFDAGVLDGKLGTGVLETIRGEGIRFSITLDREPPARAPLRIAVGFPRPIQLRRLLRDCASFGLTAVDLVMTELGEKSYRNATFLEDGGAQDALIEGAIQARDTRLPEFAVYSGLESWITAMRILPGMDVLCVAADNVRPQGSFAALEMQPPGKHAVLAIGSERGWSDQERTVLERSGFLRLSMGRRALRTETACIAAVVILMEKLRLL